MLARLFATRRGETSGVHARNADFAENEATTIMVPRHGEALPDLPTTAMPKSTAMPPRTASMPRRLLLGIGLLGSLVVFAFLALLFWPRAVVTADEARIEGYVLPVAPRVGGQLAEILVQQGRTVQEGEPVALLDSRDLEARLAAASAEVRVAETALASASARLEAARARTTTGTWAEPSGAADPSGARGPLETIASAEAATSEAQARLEHARASLRVAELQLEFATLRAPIAGTVTAIDVARGASLQPNAPILTLIGTEELWVTALFDERRIGSMHAGQQASMEVDAFEGARIDGHVESIGAVENGRATVRIAIDNTHGVHLVPGLSARAQVRIARRN